MGIRKMFLLALCVAMAGCALFSPAAKKAVAGGTEPKAIRGFDWFLVEIKIADGVIAIDRSLLEDDGMGEWFSVRFSEDDRISGKAAPNRYSAPCQWGGGNSLTIGIAAVTRMLSFKEFEGLSEAAFLEYIATVSRWSLVSAGRLELHCADGAVLAFGR